MNLIVGLDARTLAMHDTATATLSEGLVFGGGRAWALKEARPSLAAIDPLTGKVTRTMAVPPPSATGDDYVVAGPGLLWLFRGSRLFQLNPATGTITASARVDPIAPAIYSPALIAGRNLWYLAKISHGTVLDQITPARVIRRRAMLGRAQITASGTLRSARPDRRNPRSNGWPARGANPQPITQRHSLPHRVQLPSAKYALLIVGKLAAAERHRTASYGAGCNPLLTLVFYASRWQVR